MGLFMNLKCKLQGRVLFQLLLFQASFLIRAASFEVELSIGRELIELRNQFIGLLDRGLSSQPPATEQKRTYIRELENSLRDSFRARGGYDLGGSINSLQWGWVSSSNRSWLLLIKGEFEQNSIKEALEIGGWTVSETEKNTYSFQGMSVFLSSSRLIVYSRLSQDKALKYAGSFQSPRGWIDLRVYNDLLRQLEKRDPRLLTFLQPLKSLGTYCSVQECRLDGSIPAHSVSLVSGALTSLRDWVIGTLRHASTPSTGGSMLDFWQFARGPLLSGSILSVLEKVEVLSSGGSVTLRLDQPGSPEKLLLETMPRFILGVGAHLGVALVQNREKIQSFVKAFEGGAACDNFPRVGGGESKKGPCPNTLRLARRAVEFYRADYGGNKTFEEIKPKLFELGYLPVELKCEERVVMDHRVFKTGRDGKLYPVSKVNPVPPEKVQ